MLQKKKMWIAAAVSGACCAIALLAVIMVNQYSLTLSVPASATVVLEYGETYEAPDVTALYQGTLFNKQGTDVVVQTSGEVNPEKLGTYTLTYTAAHKKLTSTATQTVIVQDTTPPMIELVAAPDYFTSPIAEYVEEGFTARDNCDGDLTAQVQRLPGKNFVLYRVMDSSGNQTSVTREIVYKDVVPPTITLAGEAEVAVEVGKEYVDLGYTAEDDCDGDLTAAVTVDGVVDVSKMGLYMLTYRVQDSYGNVAETQRQVEVKDMTAPSIHLSGGRVYVRVGAAFSEPGYTATDNLDGDVSSKVVVQNGVDASKVGTYTVTYSVTDSSGNTATATRSVYVYQRQAANAAVNPGDKVVYLTFDDGPGKHTGRLLDILDQFGVKATFFVTNQFSGYQNMIGEASRRGHTIALHTYSHDFSDIYRSEEAYFADLQKISDICVAQTGKAPSIIRFPGGTGNTVSRKYCSGIMSLLSTAVGYHGYYYCDWNVDSRDAGGTTSADGVAQNVIEGIQGRSVSVVLQHDIKGYSVDAVEQILAWGLANGYTFLPMGETTPMVHHKARN